MRSSDLDDVCPSIGLTATLTLQAWYGGRHLYIPLVASPSHPLVHIIGESPFKALVRDWPGCVIRVPTSSALDRLHRERRVAEMLAQGNDPTTIADVVGLGVRRVQQLQHELAQRGWIRFATGLVGQGGRARKAAYRAPPVLTAALPEIFETGGDFQQPPGGAPAAASAG